MIEAEEKESKTDEMAMARKELYITKGSYIHKQLVEIKTGENAISFFAKYGSNTPIKYIRCIWSDPGPLKFRPYDLVVVGEEHQGVVDKVDNFYISAQGVVHMSHQIKMKGRVKESTDVVHTEFFWLSDWMQQSTMFNVLTSMKFFRTYINGKIFALWKGNVRHKKYLRTRQKLAWNLIWSWQAFLPTFCKINKGLLKMSLNKTFTIPKTNKAYQLDEFNKE